MRTNSALLGFSIAAVAQALSAPQRIIDGHVHITNTSLFEYNGWVNASAGVCPCAPPCLCDWGISDWASASSTLSPGQFVFIEVDADQEYWLEEVSWVQSLSDAGLDGGRIGGIVAHAPPGFGVPGIPDTTIDRALAQLATLPLARGVRAYLNWSDITTLDAAVRHTQLLAARGLSMDVCLGGMGGNPAASAFLLNLTSSVPSARFIVDHLGSPPVLGSAGDMAVWAQTVQALAALPNVYVKIGGAFQYFKTCLTCPSTFPTLSQVTPLVTQVIQAFGWDRSLWEGNWFFVDWYSPANLDTYSTWVSYTQSILTSMQPAPTPAQQDALWYGTAALAYKVASP